MRSASNHRELIAWQEAILLVEAVFRETAKFPREERYGLATQLRRSAISIPSNIAEGAGRNTTRELAHFLGIASGSRSELNTQLVIAQRLGLVGMNAPVFDQLERVGKLLTALRRAVQAKASAAETWPPTIHDPQPTIFGKPLSVSVRK